MSASPNARRLAAAGLLATLLSAPLATPLAHAQDDPHARHSMPDVDGSASGAADPHAGHADHETGKSGGSGNSSTTESTEGQTSQDPHAGHVMSGGMDMSGHEGHDMSSGMDPHAGHDMPMTVDPHAGHAGMAHGAPAADASEGGHSGHGNGTMAPSLTRSPDYSDGIAPAGMHAMGMHDEAILGMLMLDRLEFWDGREAQGQAWEGSAWYGGDTDRLYLASEGERADGHVEDADLEVMWNHATTPFWDTQLGLRQDFGDGPDRTWSAFGVQGLAPYWFEIRATAYLGEDWRTAARFSAEYELRLTQRLILQPEVELDAYGKSDRERGIGSGLSSGELGLRLRYEIRRTFAPYVGVVWERAFGQTADYAREAGHSPYDQRWVAGLRIWF